MKRSEFHPHSARQYINGRWETGATMGERRNPSDTAELVVEYARADRSQADRAVRAAADAFGAWSDSAAQRRADALEQIGAELHKRKDELGLLLARELGRPVAEAVAEVVRAAQLFRFFAGEALRMAGQSLAPPRPGVQVDVTREPVGVVALISTWSAPLALAARQIAPALAFGNSVVFKPSELAPACGWALAEIISRAALPAGAFNLLMGSARVLGPALAEHPAVDALSVVGSAAAGAQLLKAGASRRLRVQLASGAANALVVMADADLERAVECALGGAYSWAGQRCTASSRLIVEAPVHDAFVARLRQRVAALRVGHALEKGVEVGPVVDAAHLARHLERVRAGTEEGAELLCGGEALERASRGHFMSPALFLARPHHRVARDELFGPLACVLQARDYEHALALVNDTPDGLCAGICTRSLSHATHFRRHARVGVTLVNLPTTGVDEHASLGARRGSGLGAGAQGRGASEFFTTFKTGYMLA